MEFSLDKVEEFHQLFDSVQPKILAFDGCHHVELYGDDHHANVFYTFSKWDHAEALENYRKSPFFEDTWSKTKKLFNGKPQAFALTTGNR